MTFPLGVSLNFFQIAMLCIVFTISPLKWTVHDFPLFSTSATVAALQFCFQGSPNRPNVGSQTLEDGLGGASEQESDQVMKI